MAEEEEPRPPRGRIGGEIKKTLSASKDGKKD